MKRLLFDSLLIVSLLVLIVPPAKAQFRSSSDTSTAAEPIAESTATPAVSPFRLVDLARNGYFEAYGIPSHAALVSAVQTGRVTAEDLVESAITDRRLTADKLDDRRYLRSVDRFLEHLLNESNGRS
jgi:hypothetical protein